MNFDVKYPAAKMGDMPEPDLYRGRFAKTCACGNVTHWMDFDLRVTVCSEECLENEILKNARASDPSLLTLLSVVEKTPPTKPVV